MIRRYITAALRSVNILIALLILAIWAGLALAAEPAVEVKGVDQDVQSLKKELVDLNKDLFKLEEEQLVLAGGRTRWLAHATREVEMVLEQIRRTEVMRAADWLGLVPSAVPTP